MIKSTEHTTEQLLADLEASRRENDALQAEIAALRDSASTMSKELDAVTQVCNRASRGDLEARVIKIDGDSETAGIAHSVNRMLDLTDAFVREAKAALEHASEEKFYRRVLTRGFSGTFAHAATIINAATESMQAKTQSLADARTSRLALADDFEMTVEGVVSAVVAAATEMEATAQSLNGVAGIARERIDTLEHSVIDLDRAIDTVGGVTEGLVKSVQQVRKRAGDSATVAEKAGADVCKTSETIHRLEESSNKIRDVIRLISTIAAQTNMLALNASVEAARAGDAGRGFAVVADEVKSLADRTREATDEIETIILDITGKTSEAVTSVERVAGTIEQVGRLAGEISSAVEEQSTAAQEIGSSMTAAGRNTQTVRVGVEAESSSARDTEVASTEMLNGAGSLSQMALTLQAELVGFMDSIRRG